MGHKHSRDEILDAASRVAQRDGLGALSFGRVAAEADTSDRIVVYYFADKSRLVGAVLEVLGDRLRAVLDASLPVGRATPPSRADILAAARPIFTAAEHRPTMRLFVEAVGLGAAGREPFVAITTELLRDWVDWLAGHMGGDADEAVATVAAIDGLVIVGLLLGADAEAAAWDAHSRDGSASHSAH